ncbi:MAG: universal stress protein [Mariniphaga sp.]|nr:universal stress protein [Mariniphaga sp.]
MENQLVTILRITKPQLGSFVKNKFEANGIECFFTNEGLILGDEYNPDEVILKVRVNQSEEAIKALLQIHKDYDLDKIQEDISFVNLKKILVPVKLIDNCIDICKYAMLLAKKINAEVKLLYVYPDPNIDQFGKHTASWERHAEIVSQEAHTNAQLRLVEFSDEFKNQIPKTLFESVKLHYRMLKGTFVNVIADASLRYNPDIILMGTRSKLNKNSNVPEKTIVKVIEQSNYPVLIVPDSVAFREENKINVMYASDFYEEDNSSLNKLLNILQSFEKEIHCVHIDLNDDPHHQKKVTELNKMLAKEYSDLNIQCELFESVNILQGFYDFVEKNNIDIISFSKMKRSAFYKMFHPSFQEELVSSKKVPILIFPV